MIKNTISQWAKRQAGGAALVAVVTLLASCVAALPSVAAPDMTATPPAPTLATAATPTPVRLPDETPSALDAATLTVWMPEGFEPGGDLTAGQALAEQALAFDQARPDIRVDFYPKRVRGAGGIAAYLRSAPPVAPGALPDLTLLDRDTLAEMSRAGLIVPIGSLVDPAVIEGLYPVAREAGSVDGQLAGLPYLLEIDHGVYRTGAFGAPPVTFQDLLDARQPFAAAAGVAGDVSSATLLPYLAAGGTLADEQGKPALDAATLEAVLTVYQNARTLEVFDTGNFQMASAQESWLAYQDQQAAVALTTSTLVLSEASLPIDTGWMSAPTLSGEPFTLARGWSWVVVTHDPARQAAAMALVNFLMNPVNQGRFSEAAGWLPSQPGALAVWGQDRAEYAAFAGRMLDSGSAMPDASTRFVVGVAIQHAFEAVLLNGIAPSEAAAQAEASVKSAP